MSPASPATNNGLPASAGLDRPAAELVRWSAGTACGLLLAAAAMLGWRRLAGAFSGHPPDPWLLAAVAAVVATTAAAARLGWRYQAARRRPGRLDWAVALGVSIGVLAAGAALSLPGTSPAALALFWAILAVEEVWAWQPVAWRRLRTGRRASPSAGREVRIDPPQHPVPHPICLPPSPDEPPDGDVTQQLTRSHAPDGSETLAGWLRVPLAAGQRVTNCHVAFCPPFPQTPRLAVEQLDGPEARIKTVQLLPYGARLDLKLAGPSEVPETVLLQFSAQATPPAAPSDPAPDHDAGSSTFA